MFIRSFLNSHIFSLYISDSPPFGDDPPLDSKVSINPQSEGPVNNNVAATERWNKWADSAACSKRVAQTVLPDGSRGRALAGRADVRVRRPLVQLVGTQQRACSLAILYRDPNLPLLRPPLRRIQTEPKVVEESRQLSLRHTAQDIDWWSKGQASCHDSRWSGGAYRGP